MHKWVQGSPMPSYLTNLGALNLGGIMTWRELVRLSRSTRPQALEPSMICSFSTRVSTWLLTWPYPDSDVLSLEGSTSWLFPCWIKGGTVWPWFDFGGSRVSFSTWGIGPSWLWLDELCPSPITSYCIIHIILAICSFIWTNSVTFTSGVEGSLVDISLARDLVMMGSRCGGNLNCFLWAIFSLCDPGTEKNGMGEKWGTFDNVETQHQHEVSLGPCLFKMHLSFLKILAWTLNRVFIMVSFYSDARLMHKLGK